MSPEQCGAVAELSPASDIYSLGALGYYLLTGSVLFPGRSSIQMIAAHLYETPASMSAAGARVPAELEAIIRRCLAKRPEDRFADVASLEAALKCCEAAAHWGEREACDWWNAHVDAKTCEARLKLCA